MRTGKEYFKDFILEEYSTISQAHFKTIETISSFFRYYLLIMSIPASSIYLVVQLATKNSPEFLELCFRYQYIFGMLSLVISLSGLLVCVYIINLRLDSILYARTINGIRKYFYDSDTSLSLNTKIKMRVLPQSPSLPSYLEKSYFLPVVICFAILNSFYFFLYLQFSDHFLELSSKISASIVLYFVPHFVFYCFYAYHREFAYLKSHVIGVDIDGVLNNHREHFCKLLKKYKTKDLDSEEINIIPVHENPQCQVTRENEMSVFNRAEYWTEMPTIDPKAPRVLNSLYNSFKFSILIFTYRPWPEKSTAFRKLLIILKWFGASKKIRDEYFRKLDDSLKKEQKVLRKVMVAKENRERLRKCAVLLLNIVKFLYLLVLICRVWFIKLYNNILLILNLLKPIRFITRIWLLSNGFKFNRIYFETGNDFTSDPRVHLNNRFYISTKKKIRFFIEDDLDKAIKLSYICDAVFLIDQPYNRIVPNDLPKNIIRVGDWQEIKERIRKMI